MALICPTVLAADPEDFRNQIERVSFAPRVQIDLTDGQFAPSQTVGLGEIWWSETMQVDLHMMYQSPEDYLDDFIRLRPHLVIVHAEAQGDLTELAASLHGQGIKFGVALLKDTPAEAIQPLADVIDHVLIFSGDLGKFGGQADLSLLEKVKAVDALKSGVEVGWDGGINDQNAVQLAAGGVSVLNVGGFIQKADGPKDAYQQLVRLINPA